MRLEAIARVLNRGGHEAIVHALRGVRARRSTEKHFAEKLERCMRAAHAVLANLEGIAA
ncbi:MAG: hypothetical protein IPL39_14610 [Opitutaceae bacterium]|nr:hypothetical protein [Opitutaceae bacterium]